MAHSFLDTSALVKYYHDALQLAVALALFNQALIEHFVCADHGLCATAMEEHLSVIRPSDV